MRSSARAISFHVSWLVSSSSTELAPTATDVLFVIWLASPDSNSSSSSSAFIPLFSLLVTFVTGDVADSLPPLVLLPLQQAIPFKTEKKCHAWHKHEHTNSMALKDNGINTKRSIKTLRSSYPYKSSLNYVTPSSQARKLPIVMLLLALASLVRARLN